MSGTNLTCGTCRNWQGKREWGLCLHYCAIAAPSLLHMKSPLPLMRFEVPFDPHDMKYFYSDVRVTKDLTKSLLHDGVRRIVKKEEDLKFIINDSGEIIGERVGKSNIVYFYTRRDFSKCWLGEDR